MSGFDPDWLDLREPVDHRSLAPEPVAALVALFAGRDEITVADLACGSGSMLRVLASRLPARQRWTLIDHDPGLLAHARTRLARWADTAEEDGHDGRLTLAKGEKRIEVVTERRDLAADPLPEPAAAADLVTASALFDLVGRDWLAAFVDRLAVARRPLYAPLIFDGRKTFEPPNPLDGAVLAAFNVHQRGDKGFGQALGAAAPGAMASLAEAAGLDVVRGESPWRLGPAEAKLAVRLVEGVAAAVRETGDPPRGLADWLAFRRAAASKGGGEVGHVDLLLTRSAP